MPAGPTPVLHPGADARALVKWAYAVALWIRDNCSVPSRVEGAAVCRAFAAGMSRGDCPPDEELFIDAPLDTTTEEA